MNKQVNRSIVVLTLIASMMMAFATPVFADAPALEQQTAKYEIKFMENMIDHHAMAVMMAEMCIMKAIHPALIATCENIMATQSAEIEMMQTWLQDWHGITYEPKVMMGEMEGRMTMNPAQFEKWFLKRMIGHHASAIKEAEDCLEQAYHNELINMCQNIFATQSQEIETMQAWLCEWYEVCNYRQNLYEIELQLQMGDKDAPTSCRGILLKSAALSQVTGGRVFQARNTYVLTTLISAEERVLD